ncbi:MAG: acetate--CoA ligase family protein [Thermoplasmata archaeon]|nr:acetate--CoA ligase family protein [Thermoplasmata archaeon]
MSTRPSRKSATEYEAKMLLRKYGIPTTDFAVVKSGGSIEIEFPAVLKVLSPDILHKTDVGGVRLNILNREELERELGRFREKFPGSNFLVEKMEPQGVEMIAGLVNDPSFGMSIMVGMGGIFAEVYRDVSFRLVPITKKDAEKMLDDLKAGVIFDGFRGMDLDKNAMVDLLVNLSRMGTEEPIDQMDLNPVLVYRHGVKVVDAKLVKGE